jgi:hypothetical protein
MTAYVSYPRGEAAYELVRSATAFARRQMSYDESLSLKAARARGRSTGTAMGWLREEDSQ